MIQFPVHTPETAPAGSAPQLEQIRKSFGFIPNLAGALAEAPAALEAYFGLGSIFDKTSFSATERQIVLLSVSAEIDEFIAAGFSRAQILEVLVGVSMKTLSNYVNHIAKTPLDPAFAMDEWTEPALQNTAAAR